jgi:hypothetical protein
MDSSSYENTALKMCRLILIEKVPMAYILLGLTIIDHMLVSQVIPIVIIFLYR